LYFNARSLVPKYSELCAVVKAYNPDIVCIVESWLGDCVFDKEVAIPGYRTHRLDRNRHRSGIIVYVSEALISNIISLSSHGMELLSLAVYNTSQCKVCIHAQLSGCRL